MTTELLAEQGERSATIEEYVDAAKLLTRLRRYRAAVLDQIEALGNPEFEGEYRERDFADASLLAGLRAVDQRARDMNRIVDELDALLALEVWSAIETQVKAAAQRFQRSGGGTTACVPDAEGKWIVMGSGQLLAGTEHELREHDTWTALDDILPPPRPAAAGRMMSPGTA